MNYRARVGDDEIDCRLTIDDWPRVSASVGGRSYDFYWTRIGEGAGWIALDGRSIELVVREAQGGYTVRVGEDMFEVALVRARRRRDGVSASVGGRRREIRAPMPGRVVEVRVGVGDRVEAGQGLVVLEAMKMRNEIPAPGGGTVRRVTAVEGASVNAGDLLALIE